MTDKCALQSSEDECGLCVMLQLTNNNELLLTDQI